MSQKITLTLTPETSVEDLITEHGAKGVDLKPFAPDISEMIRDVDAGGREEIVVIVDWEDRLDKDGYIIGGDSRTHVLLFVDYGNAIVTSYGVPAYVDACCVEDALAAYNEDQDEDEEESDTAEAA